MFKRCSTKNRNGRRCGAWAVTGATKCALHSDPERAAVLGSKHGRRVTFRSRPSVLDLPHKSLKSIGEVSELLRRNDQSSLSDNLLGTFQQKLQHLEGLAGKFL